MKLIKYMRHAKNRMRMHGITEADVEVAIEKPEFTDPSTDGRVNIWKKIDEKFLRVTCKNEPARILVITAVRKKKGWGDLP